MLRQTRGETDKGEGKGKSKNKDKGKGQGKYQPQHGLRHPRYGLPYHNYPADMRRGCSYCGSTTHRRHECTECRNCGYWGHFDFECPQRNPVYEWSGYTSTTTGGFGRASGPPPAVPRATATAAATQGAIPVTPKPSGASSSSTSPWEPTLPPFPGSQPLPFAAQRLRPADRGAASTEPPVQRRRTAEEQVADDIAMPPPPNVPQRRGAKRSAKASAERQARGPARLADDSRTPTPPSEQSSAASRESSASSGTRRGRGDRSDRGASRGGRG